MTTISIYPSTGYNTSSSVAVQQCNHGCIGPCHQRINNLVVCNDQSAIKGLAWGFGAFKVGSATLGTLGLSLIYSPLLLTPLAVVPVVLGLTTLALGEITFACIDNASYHLGSRQVKVIQTY